MFSQPLSDEITSVLQRARIRRRWQANEARVQEIVMLLSRATAMPTLTGSVQICRDPHDDFVLETAILGGASHVVSRDEDITRDWALLSYLRDQGIAVLTVAQFLDMLQNR